jgi:organic radical activating enzyme
MTSTGKNFYCSQKFWWLTVDIEKFQTLSCCAATPSKIDLTWLKQNPGKLFNSPELLKERTMMLNNQPVNSCSPTCWVPESKNLISRRIRSNSQAITHTDIQSDPTTLHIIVGSNCNLTCSYCCKQYSSAWLNDINKNGDYSDIISNDDRFVINNSDKILLKLSQKDISKSQFNQQLINEIQSMCNSGELKEINISGGEPFLYLGLEQLINGIPPHIKIHISSGLGVDTHRFDKELAKLIGRNITITISGENIQESYEFNRYGNTWERFNKNIETIKASNIDYRFGLTLSNLTVFGLFDFINHFKGESFVAWPCTDPDFLSISVLDHKSKQLILESCDTLPDNIAHIIKNSIEAAPSSEQLSNLRNFLQQFTSRRNLSMNIFPVTFRNWVANG